MPINNYLASSSVAKPGVCTSTTRPAVPYQGQVIYQTDTNQLVVWNGAYWTCITPQCSSTTTQTNVTASSFTTFTGDPAVSLQTGTKALITLTVRQVIATAAGYSQTACVVSGSSSIAATDGGSVQNYFNTGDFGNDRASAFTYLETGLTPGINTFTMCHKRTGTGSMTVTQRSITVVGIP